jgi:hydrogenase large subunit
MEESLLGCEIDRWLENKSLADMEEWLTESNHQDSDIGTYVRYSREIGLDRIGKGPGKFLSYGAYELPEAVRLVKQVGIWIREIDARTLFYKKPIVITEAKGAGLIEAARGALGHWIAIKDGKIERYQIITPTAWNLSPKDFFDQHGACEQALNGTIVEDADNPIEVGHVVRSFDPCLVCTVHTIKK